jgi:Nucleoporin autopeptidase
VDGSINPNAPRLTREYYYTIPPLNQLQQLSDAELARVEQFVVGRHLVGTVEFTEPTDVRGLDLDRIVFFKRGEVILYPESEDGVLEAEEMVEKPEVYAWLVCCIVFVCFEFGF